MPIVQIEGGLGSQMFGYAAARRLGIKFGEPVFIDTRLYRSYHKFVPELHHFNIDAVLLSDDQADEICGVHDELVPVVRPGHLHFDASVLDVESPFVLMKGNYVSQDYFFDCTEQLRRDFTRASDPGEHFERLSSLITRRRNEGFSPVAIHVRRGDYVREADVNAVHGLCTPEYYERARELMSLLVARPWFFLFSDEPDEAYASVNGPRVTPVTSPPGAPPIDDMLLMAECDHHILANSGYSWWAAWLAERAGHRVIVPRPYIQDRRLNAEDMVLRDWIGLGTQAELIPSAASGLTD